MYEELKEFPFKIYKCKESLIIHNKELGEELSKFGKCTTKFIPDNIKELNPELIRIFLIAYSKADGTLKKGKIWKGYKFNDSIQFFTSSDKLASDLGELILKAGGRPSYYLNKCAGKEIEFRNGVYTINKDVWTIRWNTQVHNYLYNMEIADIEYDDSVYCVEVPKYHTLLVRRNGKVCWSGNCRTVIAPYFDDESTRASRDENGEYKEVKYMNYKEWKDQYIKKDELGLTLNQKSAIMRYIGSDSYKINEALRNGTNLTQDQKEWVKLLDEALEKIPVYEGQVTRSLSFQLQGKEALEEFLKLYNIGNEIEYPAYTSATIGEIYNPSGEVQLTIISKTARNITTLNKGEQEVLFERCKKFKVVARYDTSKIHYILMEEL